MTLGGGMGFLGRTWGLTCDRLAAQVVDAAGFVGYGVAGGARAVEHLRLIMGELQVAPDRTTRGRAYTGHF
ncbi:MAG TPA: hypothetical protein VFV66_26075 [Nonomuraea sp.]|nr:hypothetical protein [Nonomuraea sp.]